MNEFNIRLLFEMYKDKAIMGRRKFAWNMIKKHHISDEEAKRIYDMILNYQIDRYGEQINFFRSGFKMFNTNFDGNSRNQRRKRINNTIRNRQEEEVLKRVYEDK